jgi:hypothetical protein
MFRIESASSRLCDRVVRREVLRVGGLACCGLTLGQQRLSTAVAAGTSAAFGRAKSCIVLFLMGGPPQHSTWDPKPSAIAEIRGPFNPIQTVVPGIQIGELLPHSAQVMDRVALLRAVSTGDNAHSSSGYAMLTGVPHVPPNAENANPGAPNDWPSMAGLVQHLHQGRQLLPASIRLPHHIFNTDQSTWPGQDAGFLGRHSDPWLFRCEPTARDWKGASFAVNADVPLARLDTRRTLLEQLEEQLRAGERAGRAGSYSSRQQQALDLLTDARARSAADLTGESDATRDRYGRTPFGNTVLLARRFVQAGVRLVQVNWYRGPDEPSENPCWDSHTDEPNRLKNVLCPPADQAFAALVSDLDEQGLLDETLVLCLAEFGRTPRFNPRAGRDHWGPVFSIAAAGGGVQGGRVHGASDRDGGQPAEGLVRPADVTATLFHLLGLDPATEVHDTLGRPFPISRGRVIDEIL